MVQPVLKVVSSAVTPHQGHGEMGVSVDQAGHHHLTGTVHFPIVIPEGTPGTDKCDLGAVHRDKGIPQQGLLRIHGDGGNMVKKNRHKNLRTPTARN